MNHIHLKDTITCVCIHGAGGGAWEFDYIWKEALSNEPYYYSFSSIDLEPCADGFLEHTTFSNYVDQVVDFVAKTQSRRVVLIGASMGGILALKAYEYIRERCVGLILICSTSPIIDSDDLSIKRPHLYPPRIHWANSSTALEDTAQCLPDASQGTHEFAAARWRDESGCVLNEINEGIALSSIPSVPMLSVIPLDDESIPAIQQFRLAAFLGGDTMSCEKMRHISPLLGDGASDVAKAVGIWIKEKC